MKKLTLALAVAAVAMGSTAANAYVVAIPSGGVLVPLAYHNGPLDTTAIGLINHNVDTDNSDGVRIYWSFFNTNSQKLIDGQFEMTPGDYYGISLHDLLSGELAGVRGYLTFVIGKQTRAMVAQPICDIPGVAQGGILAGFWRDFVPSWIPLDSPLNGCAIDFRGGTPSLSGTAFQANAAVGDAEFVPVMPIVNSIDWAPGTNLLQIEPNDLRHLVTGAGSSRLLGLLDDPPVVDIGGGVFEFLGELGERFDVRMDLRYTQNADTSTQFVIWATNQLNDPTPIGHAVQIYNDEQLRQSGRLICGNNRELCVANVAGNLTGRPAAWENGYVRFPVYTRPGQIANVRFRPITTCTEIDPGPPQVLECTTRNEIIPESLEDINIIAPTEFMVSYSRVTSAFFGATQTLLGTHMLIDPVDTAVDILLGN